MDVVEAVAVRIAERAVPDEADLAPALIGRHLAGERQGASGGATRAGGFGGMDMASDFLTLVNAIQPMVAAMASLLAMGSAVTSIAVNNLNMRERRLREDKASTTALPDGKTLKSILLAIEGNLRKAGVDEQRAVEMSRQALIAILEEPREGAQFLDAVAGAAD
jgi:hypothetical protein